MRIEKERIEREKELIRKQEEEKKRIMSQYILKKDCEKNLEDMKNKLTKEYQEKEIEGFMARQDYLDGVKEDELKAEQEKQRKNRLREEFIQGNEEAKLRKKKRMLKEIEDEKKRVRFFERKILIKSRVN